MPSWPKPPARKIDVKIIRNGSRGLLWLEPFVEVETPKGRVAFGGVEAGDVKSLFDSKFHEGGKHKLSLGLTEELALSQEPGTPHLRALRHHRSAFA